MKVYQTKNTFKNIEYAVFWAKKNDWLNTEIKDIELDESCFNLELIKINCDLSIELWHQYNGNKYFFLKNDNPKIEKFKTNQQNK